MIGKGHLSLQDMQGNTALWISKDRNACRNGEVFKFYFCLCVFLCEHGDSARN